MSSAWNPSDPNLKLELRATANDERDLLMLRLCASLRACGCFMLADGVGSITQQVLNFEAPLWNLFTLYSTLQAASLDLTRDSHQQLTALSMLRHHPGIPYSSRVITAQLTIQLNNETEHAPPLTGFA